MSERVTTAPGPPNARGVSLEPRWETKVGAPPSPGPRPAPCPAPGCSGLPLEAACGAGQAGGAGPVPGRGAAARGASRPRGLGSLRLGLPSSPDAAMEDERKDGAYGRSCLGPGVASAELGGLGGGVPPRL